MITSVISLSHVFVFAMFIIIIFILNFKGIYLLIQQNRKEKIQFLRNYLYLFISLVPGLLFMGIFVFTNQSMQRPFTYLSTEDLFISLKYIMPAKGIHYADYALLTKLLLYTFVLLSGYIFMSSVFYSLTKKLFSKTNVYS